MWAIDGNSLVALGELQFQSRVSLGEIGEGQRHLLEQRGEKMERRR